MIIDAVAKDKRHTREFGFNCPPDLTTITKSSESKNAPYAAALLSPLIITPVTKNIYLASPNILTLGKIKIIKRLIQLT